jgi:protein involved in polysaccharide export with SLBB domain
MAGSRQCSGLQNATGTPRDNSSLSVTTPVLTNPPGAAPEHFVPGPPPTNPSQMPQTKTALKPETEFEQLVADSVGRPLPLFGQSMFQQAPSTFAPVDWTQVPSDYVIGPGDELQINLWGQIQANLRVVVDRSGQIYIPQVGSVSVAGVHYGDLEAHLTQEISKVFKHFNLTANIGRLRSIQVVVVGNARYPGTYTISSLSTLVNAIFVSGGPSPQGSLRQIQVRRDGNTITNFDFYDLLINGDKSKDVRLMPGDVLYIPPVGPLVAVSGSVNTPAIYEIKPNTSLKDIIEIAGDLSILADVNKITIDRVVDHQARRTLEFPYDDLSRAQLLVSGDIVRVFSIVPRFEDTVTLRGNVANPGRYAWKAGMRVSDLIPDAQSLLTRGYWRNRAAIVSGRATEYPLAETKSLSNFAPVPESTSQTTQTNRTSAAQQNATTTPVEGSVSAETGAVVEGGAAMQNAAAMTGSAAGPANANSRSYSPSTQPPSQAANQVSTSPRARTLVEELRSYAPEINWDYAIIQRVNPVDLTSQLIWLSPRKAVLEHDPNSNLELQAGDIVTIFSQRDISVPKTERSQYVIVEGEVVRPGVYKLAPNETLHSLMQRAGGLTPNAYVYGAQLTRESARIDQQKSIDELAHTMEIQIRQSAISVAASSQSGDAGQIVAAQEAIIQQLKNTRASGRVALPLTPRDKDLSAIPDLVLEDSDRLAIPQTPATISVIGDVYNPGSFIFEPRNSTAQYLEMAGKGKPQSDLHHAFVLRANGVVVAANNVNGLFAGSRFDRLRLYPGDQIIVPYKLPTGAFIRGLRDWTQVSSQLALTAAALAVLQ